MNYQQADINTKINLKANRIILYGKPVRHLITRMVDRNVGLFESRYGMMTQPEQYKEPRNAGRLSY